MSRKVKVGIVQMTCSLHQEENLSKAKLKIQELSEGGAQIICFQELFMSVYFCDQENHDNFKLAEKIPGSTTNYFSSLAKDNGVVIIASLFEKRTNGLYHNTTVVIDADGTYLGKYRKIHIPEDPGYHEKFYFAPGDLGYKIFSTQFAKIGVLICWDQWFPEAARITAIIGAEIIFYPTAIGWALDQDQPTNLEQFNAWTNIQRSHSIANGIHVVSVNRIGIEGKMRFWGGSFFSNPFGTILFQASNDKEETHIEELDLEDIDVYRTHWPFLRDRRIDSYKPILNLYIDK